jgi:hypothetical protein
MTWPDLEIAWHRKQLSPTFEKIFGTTPGKVASCGSYVWVEKGIAAEDII